MDAYEAEHVYLVLKDKMEERLWPAIEKAARKLDGAVKNGLVIKTPGGIELYKHSDILYIEHNGRKTNVVMTNDTIVTKAPVAALVKSLPAQFCFCHQSFVVNLDHVCAFEKDCFILYDNTRIPISRAHKKEAKKRF